jgi:hypothetical protein
MMLKRRPKPKMGVRIVEREYPAHKAWVRKHVCSVPGCPSDLIEAAHVRKGLPEGEQAGMGEKPHDRWCIALCSAHHKEQHAIGEQTFAAKYGLDLVALAKAFAKESPHRVKWENAE